MTATLNDLRHWRFEIDFENIAWAIIDQQGKSTNTLGTDSMTELERIVSHVEEAARGKKSVR
jgi:3-hydroxyacyl-CoA dehydrogenase/enoyl-CoA hydratase/3-hydroxybutyryl-CoA epimerase